MRIATIRNLTATKINTANPKEAMGVLPSHTYRCFARVGIPLSQNAIKEAFEGCQTLQEKALLAGMFDIYHREFAPNRAIELNDKTLPIFLDAMKPVFRQHYRSGMNLSDMTPLFQESYKRAEQPFGDSVRKAIISLYTKPSWLKKAKTFEPSILVGRDEEDVARIIVDLIMEVVASKEKPRIGFATGRTMNPVIDELCAQSSLGFDMRRIIASNIDEYISIPPRFIVTASFAYFLQNQLYKKLGIKNPIAFKHDAANPLDEAKRVEDAIKSAGKIDLQMFGIGLPEEPHIAFISPFSPFVKPEDVSKIEQTIQVVGNSALTRRKNASAFGDNPDFVSDHAFSFSHGTIMKYIDRSIVVITGPEKIGSAKKILEGLNEENSASGLLLKQNVTVVLDEETAKVL